MIHLKETVIDLHCVVVEIIQLQMAPIGLDMAQEEVFSFFGVGLRKEVLVKVDGFGIFACQQVVVELDGF